MKIIKYIIDELGIPILFEKNIIHSDIIVTTNVFSAGYAIISYNLLLNEFSVKCYGGSESLKIKTNKNDSLVIKNYLKTIFNNSDVNFLINYHLDLLIDNKVV